MFNLSFENILHSNLINFALMLGLFIAIFVFLNVPKILSNSVEKMKKDIENSNSEKENSLNSLKNAKEKYENSENEVNDIIKSANKISDDFISKAEKEAEGMIEKIKDDYEIIFEREVSKIKKEVEFNTSLKSLQKTEEKLKAIFQDEKKQEEYLNSAIEKLEGIEP